MLSEGCKGESAEQIYQVCSISPNSTIRHQQMSDTITEINSENQNFQLKTVNAIWPALNPDFILQKNFENIIISVYQGIVKELNYSNPEEATQIINNFISESTNEKITNLIPQGAITYDTRLVLTNSIYFKGQWEYQFNPNLTFTTEFYSQDGQNFQVEMMTQFAEMIFQYYENEIMQIVRLPYKGDQVSMYVILPKEDILEFDQIINENEFQQWRNQLQLENINLYIPRFKLEWSSSLIQPLQQLGITDIFSIKADLSGIDGQKDLIVDEIIQKSIIEVNEFGTEAAAATAIIVSKTSLPQNIKTFYANKPFIFLILHEESESILFMGKLMNQNYINNQNYQ